MTPLRQLMIEQLKLDGKSPDTRQNYIDGVVHLSKHFNKCPPLLSDEEIRSYILHLIDSGRAPKNTQRPTQRTVVFLSPRSQPRRPVFGGF